MCESCRRDDWRSNRPSRRKTSNLKLTCFCRFLVNFLSKFAAFWTNRVPCHQVLYPAGRPAFMDPVCTEVPSTRHQSPNLADDIQRNKQRREDDSEGLFAFDSCVVLRHRLQTIRSNRRGCRRKTSAPASARCSHGGGRRSGCFIASSGSSCLVGNVSRKSS